MIKRTIYLENPARLYTEQMQLCVKTEERQSRIPIEDIGLLVINHPQISMTHGLMQRLIDQNCAVVWCDEKQMPAGTMIPFAPNQLFSRKIKAQLESSEPLRKQLWKQTVQQKILNQAAVIDWAGGNSSSLKEMSRQVMSGDSSNVEAQAASLYWKLLFDDIPRFTRHRYGPAPNHLLNFGYAILRSITARSLVGSGCLPAIGIHHRNQYNPYCLADDIMEPYRPFIDLLVLQLYEGGHTEEMLTREQKLHLLQIPVLDVFISGNTSPLMIAMQRTSASLMRCYEGESRKIEYPEL